jgi:hypothetical protein
MSVNNQGISLAQQDPTRGITLAANGPANITAGTRGFVLLSSDFVNYNYGTNVTPFGNLGFATAGTPGEGPSREFYAPLLGATQGGNTAKRDEIKAFFDSHGLDTTNNTTYMFNVTWGSGSTLTGGVALVGLAYYDPNNVQLNMGVVNTYSNTWQSSGQDSFYGPIYTLPGTWAFSATFRLISPTITEPVEWC